MDEDTLALLLNVLTGKALFKTSSAENLAKMNLTKEQVNNNWFGDDQAKATEILLNYILSLEQRITALENK